MQILERHPESPSRPDNEVAVAEGIDARHLSTRLTIDARMLFSSGIGRYLREILSRWPDGVASGETYLCNSRSQIDWLASHRGGARCLLTSAGIYSLKEQTIGAALPTRSVYWVPHYNLPWFSRARLVATVHDAAPLVLHEIFKRPAQRLAARFYFGAARKSARHIIAVSAFTGRELATAARIDPRKIEIVPNGVDESWFTEEPLTDRRPSNLLFVGNLKPHKNLHRLLVAIQRLRGQGLEELTLDVVGQIDGFRTKLEADTAALLRKSPWIRLRGPVSDKELRSLYRSAGALVFPSLYEGFGLPMLEAMAAGCPVLSSRSASLPEIGGPAQPEGGAVLYFDPMDSRSIGATIEQFLAMPSDERVRMAESGRSRARTFSWRETSLKTRAILTAQANIAARR